jgi:hypothetical protein
MGAERSGRNAMARSEHVYRAMTVLLFGNLVVARLVVLGVASWHKTLAVLAAMASLLAFSPALRNRLSGRPVFTAVVRYGPWCVAVAACLRWAHFTLMPPKPLILLLLAGVAVDSVAAARWVTGPAVSALVIVLAVVAGDALLPVLKPSFAVEWQGGVVVHDPLLGYRPAASCTTRAVGRYGKRVIYDLLYSTDGLSRRVVVDRTTGSPSKHVIFMGDSFVFGVGVRDWETLPSRFATLTSDYAVYNYGCTGYGGQQMYAKLLSGSLPGEVPEASGIMCYCMHPDHIDRAVGTFRTTGWGRDFPRFVLEGDSLKLTGSFASSQNTRMKLFDVIRRSPTARRVAIAIDTRSRSSGDYELLVALVRGSSELYLNQFEGRFLVCVWPNRDPRSPGFVREITREGVPVLHLETLGVPMLSPRYQIPYDGHPTGEYYRLTAQALVRALREQGLSS